MRKAIAGALAEATVACVMIALTTGTALAQGEASSPYWPARQTRRDSTATAVVSVRGARAALVEGHRRYRRGQDLRILVVDKNPFRYSYVIQVDDAVVPNPDATVITDFLKKVGIAGQTAPAGAATPAPQDAPPANPGETTDPAVAAFVARVAAAAPLRELGEPSCNAPASEALLDQLESSVKSQANILEGIISRREKSVTILSGWAARLRADSARLMSATADARATYAVGSDLVSYARNAQSSLDSLAGAVAADTAQIDAVAIVAAGAKSDLQDLRRSGCSNVRARVDNAIVISEALITRATDAKVHARSFERTLVNLQGATAIIEGLVSSPGNFFETRIVGDFDEASTATLKITRLDAIAPEATRQPENIGEEKFRFGSARSFAIGLGPGALFGIVNRKYERVALPDPNDTSKTISTVGVTEKSNVTVPVMVMAHLRLRDITAFPTSVHLSLGTPATTDTSKVLKEWLLGVTLGLRDEKMFLSVGPHIGSKVKLNGGFKVGATVPAALQNIPTRRETVGGIGFVFTYRLY